MAIGKQAGTGLRTITKFGIIPEAIIIGADTLIRAGMGDTFDEAYKNLPQEIVEAFALDVKERFKEFTTK